MANKEEKEIQEGALNLEESSLKEDFEARCKMLESIIAEKDQLLNKRTRQLNESLNAFNNFLTSLETTIATNRQLFEKIVNEINEVQRG